MNVADAVLERLVAWGVARVFGYPGDGINGLIGAFGRAEEMAAFMACGHAKFTGQVGVCLATSGPGAIHLLNGLYDAKLDHQPVVAIVGQAPTTAIGTHYQQEVDLASLFKDVASGFTTTITTPEQVDVAVDRAMRVALAQRTVAALIIPSDIQELDAADPVPHTMYVAPGSVGVTPPVRLPDDDALGRAAAILNEGQRVAIVIGRGAAAAAAEVIEVADRLGAGVAKALLGEDVLDDTLPFVTGTIGLLGTRASWDLMSDCDTLLMVGTSFPYAQFLPQWGQARAIQIDTDPSMIGLRYPMN